MKITRITSTPVTMPYAAPVGPYVGRDGWGLGLEVDEDRVARYSQS